MNCKKDPKQRPAQYTNKVNIYKSNCFTPLPTTRSPIPPSCIYLTPAIVYPSFCPNYPPSIYPYPQPLNPAGSYCGGIIPPSNVPCTMNTNNTYGTFTPCGPCGTPSKTVGCSSCA